MARIRFVKDFQILIFLLMFGVAACQSADNNQSSENTTQVVTFPHRVQAQYARGFQISYHQNYKLLKILKPFQDQVDTLKYSLVSREYADEVHVEGTQEIPIPIQSLIVTSTTHLGLTEMLDAHEVITGMVGADYVYSQEVRDRISDGSIKGFPMGELNKEKILAMQPNLLMISGGQSSQYDNYRVLMDAGINLLVNAEWLETTPLGKAEWVKVLAALLDKEELANARFAEVAEQYNRLKERVKQVEESPLVITNLPFKGSWFVPGGNSYNAELLRDAGANYPWSDSETSGGLQKDFEVMYELGLKAEIWLNTGTAATKEDIIANDIRFKEFTAFQEGKIYNNNRRMAPTGGNDFWESGVVHPEVLLADLVKIIHPELLPDHTLHYYQKID